MSSITPIKPIPFPRHMRAKTDIYEKNKRDLINLAPRADATDCAIQMIEQGAAMLKKMQPELKESQVDRLNSAARNVAQSLGRYYA